MAKIIDFNKAKKKIVLKKSALQEFRDQFLPRGKVIYLPLRPKSLGCPKCGNVGLVKDDLSFRCRICGWYAVRIKDCPHCHGDIVCFEGEEMCVQCRTWFSFGDAD